MTPDPSPSQPGEGEERFVPDDRIELLKAIAADYDKRAKQAEEDQHPSRYDMFASAAQGLRDTASLLATALHRKQELREALEQIAGLSPSDDSEALVSRSWGKLAWVAQDIARAVLTPPQEPPMDTAESVQSDREIT